MITKDIYLGWRYFGLSLLLGALIFGVAAHQVSDFDPNTAALGSRKFVNSYIDGVQVTFNTPTSQLLSAIETVSNNDLAPVLWIGASHLYQIIDFQTGDAIAAEHANRLAKADNTNQRFVQMASGNLSPQEALWIFKSVIDSGTMPKKLIFGVVYDDFDDYHEIRPDIFHKLPIFLTQNDLDKNGEGLKHLGVVISEAGGPMTAKSHASASAFSQDSPFIAIEEKLVDLLEEYWPAYAHRSQLQAWVKFNTRGALRALVDIVRPPQSTGDDRPVIRPVRQRGALDSKWRRYNLDAVNSMVSLAKDNGVEVYLYLAPLPQVPAFAGEQPYPADDYKMFSKAVSEIAEGQKHVYFRNFQKIVPWSEWERSIVREQGLDIFHFTGPGHARLAEAVYSFVNNRPVATAQ